MNKLFSLLQNNDFEFIVNGLSMLPALNPNDKIFIKKVKNYNLGDVVVFHYKNNELLVHRIVNIVDDKYICKGDNSYRLEDITIERIVGRVESINEKKIKKISDKTIFLSYLVGKEFNKNKYDVISTKKSEIYKKYIESYQTDLKKIEIFNKNVT